MIREIFNSIMGEGKYIGRRFIFIRFAGCPLNCLYCDEEDKKHVNLVEQYPSSGKFERQNLESVEDIIKAVNRLKTPDLFSVSFTGGEPLLYHKEIKEISKILKDLGYRTFLESNGIFPERIFYFDIASIDIKLKDHFKNIGEEEYKKIYKNELKTIKKFYDMGTDVYAKVVITKDSKINDLVEISKDLSDIGDVMLCIQPATPINNIQPPSQKTLFKMMEACGEHLKDNIMLTLQIHKILNIL
ncbi:MAG: 7-carboxy-7-deazaguanine synthase QueE [Methanococci archaeon]|nr:7-carboxy-7-deazaguanine synthase QueE [Methanococci archaeon]